MTATGSQPRTPVPVEIVRDRLRRYSYRPITAEENDIGAAVLVPLYIVAGELHIVFTKRTMHMSTQRGHISFPGGRREPGDRDLLHTALRESHEEIGLDPAHVEILARIDDFSTRDGRILIAGFVGLVDPATCPYTWSPAEREVGLMLEIPAAHLLDPANVITTAERELNGRLWPNETFVFGEHRIFGATARALRNLFDIAWA
jgi:8-oxo-dGTP pyrophosphatase MutT (NUDIX family)